ncbi:uncharacterized protein MONOS_17105 [Monocercomonoides exilis]|uniref:uncharacterized protein n=1 Tax=Monocercomonoides exilis TaxID=2049356 RepID=UPI00355A63E6|nr:hypothetical protein MONOS_17105 [Monocercomonoides exilis]
MMKAKAKKNDGDEAKVRAFHSLSDALDVPYNGFVCEETIVLLFKKAQKFFAKANRSCLVNKKEKKVINHYLLDSEDLELFEEYVELTLFARLNSVKHIFAFVRIVELKQKSKISEEGEGEGGEGREGEFTVEEKKVQMEELMTTAQAMS